ncbi:hypothetical protein [Halocatena marina]|uniref:hypothetical protein n=1 Tax=Halocatena marina TaxID=2934937 RepID=UPI00200CDE51|nr:hypothetical protein [Halocatena marina]
MSVEPSPARDHKHCPGISPLISKHNSLTTKELSRYGDDSGRFFTDGLFVRSVYLL